MPDPSATFVPSARKGWRGRYGRSGIALLFLVLMISGLCLHRVLDGPKPWGKEVQKRVQAGAALRAKEYGIIGVWWGCAISAGLGGALLLGARWWMPGGPNAPRHRSVPPPQGGVFFYTGLFVVLAGGGLLRAPALTHSLWNDEEYALRRYVHGDWKETAGGGREFKPASWEDTLFENYNGNNHLLQSALARLSLEGWRLMREERREVFSETAMRLPSLVAGVFTLVGVALLGAQAGRQWCGLGAAALLALHPWHVRYAMEARGYSLMLLGMVTAVLALLHALRRDKVAAWLTFAAAQAVFLLSFAGSLYVAVSLNAIAAFELLRRREGRRLRTLIGFNLLSAIPVLVWMLPSVPQLVEFLRRVTVLPTPIGAAWARDIGSHLAAGILFINPEPDLHAGTSWVEQAALRPLWVPLLQYVLPSLAGLGLLLTLLKASAGRLIVWSLAAGGLLAIGHNALAGQSMLSWYLLYLTIPLCVAVPVACLWLAPGGEKTGGLVVLLVVALYGLATEDARARFAHHDRQPIRQTVASYREDYPEALAVVFGVSDKQIESYDPRALVVEEVASLDRIIAQARADKRPLFAVMGGRSASRARVPEVTARVLDSGEFMQHASLPGLEAMFSYEVWRLKP